MQDEAVATLLLSSTASLLPAIRSTTLFAPLQRACSTLYSAHLRANESHDASWGLLKQCFDVLLCLDDEQATTDSCGLVDVILDCMEDLRFCAFSSEYTPFTIFEAVTQNPLCGCTPVSNVFTYLKSNLSNARLLSRIYQEIIKEGLNRPAKSFLLNCVVNTDAVFPLLELLSSNTSLIVALNDSVAQCSIELGEGRPTYEGKSALRALCVKVLGMMEGSHATVVSLVGDALRSVCAPERGVVSLRGDVQHAQQILAFCSSAATVLHSTCTEGVKMNSNMWNTVYAPLVETASLSLHSFSNSDSTVQTSCRIIHNVVSVVERCSLVDNGEVMDTLLTLLRVRCDCREGALRKEVTKARMCAWKVSKKFVESELRESPFYASFAKRADLSIVLPGAKMAEDMVDTTESGTLLAGVLGGVHDVVQSAVLWDRNQDATAQRALPSTLRSILSSLDRRIKDGAGRCSSLVVNQMRFQQDFLLRCHKVFSSSTSPAERSWHRSTPLRSLFVYSQVEAVLCRGAEHDFETTDLFERNFFLEVFRGLVRSETAPSSSSSSSSPPNPNPDEKTLFDAIEEHFAGLRGNAVSACEALWNTGALGGLLDPLIVHTCEARLQSVEAFLSKAPANKAAQFFAEIEKVGLFLCAALCVRGAATGSQSCAHYITGVKLRIEHLVKGPLFALLDEDDKAPMKRKGGKKDSPQKVALRKKLDIFSSILSAFINEAAGEYSAAVDKYMKLFHVSVMFEQGTKSGTKSPILPLPDVIVESQIYSVQVAAKRMIQVCLASGSYSSLSAFIARIALAERERDSNGGASNPQTAMLLGYLKTELVDAYNAEGSKGQSVGGFSPLALAAGCARCLSEWSEGTDDPSQPTAVLCMKATFFDEVSCVGQMYAEEGGGAKVAATAVHSMDPQVRAVAALLNVLQTSERGGGLDARFSTEALSDSFASLREMLSINDVLTTEALRRAASVEGVQGAAGGRGVPVTLSPVRLLEAVARTTTEVQAAVAEGKKRLPKETVSYLCEILMGMEKKGPFFWRK